MTKICFLSSMKTRSTKTISLSSTSILNFNNKSSHFFITLPNQYLFIHLYRNCILRDCVSLRINQKAIHTNTENFRERIENWITIPNSFYNRDMRKRIRWPQVKQECSRHSPSRLEWIHDWSDGMDPRVEFCSFSGNWTEMQLSSSWGHSWMNPHSKHYDSFFHSSITFIR